MMDHPTPPPPSGLLGRAGAREITPILRLLRLHGRRNAAHANDIAFCEAYSAAARAFQHGHFDDCAERLRRIIAPDLETDPALMIPSTPQYDTRASVAKLLMLSEQYQDSPPPSSAFIDSMFAFSPTTK
jgi:hypothetical protein